MNFLKPIDSITCAIFAFFLTLCAPFSQSNAQTLFIGTWSSAPTAASYDSSTGAVIKSTLVTNAQAESDQAEGLTVTGADLFVNFGDHIGEFNANTGATINKTFESGYFTGAQNLAVAGNILYVSTDQSSDYIAEYNATSGALISGTFISLPSGSDDIVGMAISGTNLFLSGVAGSSGIAEYNLNTGALENSSLTDSSRGSLAVSGNDLYVSYDLDGVSVYNATTGAPINSALISSTNYHAVTIAVAGNDLFAATGGDNVEEYDDTTGLLLSGTFIAMDQPAYIFAQPAAIPEPGSMPLSLAGLGAIAAIFHYRRGGKGGRTIPAENSQSHDARGALMRLP